MPRIPRDKVGDKRGHYRLSSHPMRFEPVRRLAKREAGSLPSFDSASPIHFHKWFGDDTSRDGADIPRKGNDWRDYRDSTLARFDPVKHAKALRKLGR